MRHRSTVAIFVCLVLLASGTGSSAAQGPPATVAAPSVVVAALDEAPPDAVLAALPAGSRPVAFFAADLRGDGVPAWAVAFTRPLSGAADGVPGTLEAAIVVSGTGSWSVARTLVPRDEDSGSAPIGIPSTAGVALSPVLIAERMAVAFHVPIGTRRSELLLARWDGAEFATLYDRQALVATELRDLDGDGTPEVLTGLPSSCGSFITSLTLPLVYAWQGRGYAEATGRFPAVLGDSAAAVQEFLAAPPSGTVQEVACLHGMLAYLADKAGDTARVVDECHQARDTAADWAEPWFLAVCR